MKLKRCPKCTDDLPLGAFDKNAAANDGLQTWCRVCRKKHTTKKAEDNKSKWSRLDAHNPGGE